MDLYGHLPGILSWHHRPLLLFIFRELYLELKPKPYHQPTLSSFSQSNNDPQVTVVAKNKNGHKRVLVPLNLEADVKMLVMADL